MLQDYKISALQLVTKPTQGRANSLDVECSFCPNEDDPEKYIVKLNVAYTAKAKTKFSLRVLVNGYFQWQGGYREKEGDAFLAWVNGGTILYGLIRSTIAELTASSECGRVILPTVMMVDIVKAQINEALEAQDAETAES